MNKVQVNSSVANFGANLMLKFCAQVYQGLVLCMTVFNFQLWHKKSETLTDPVLLGATLILPTFW